MNGDRRPYAWGRGRHEAGFVGSLAAIAATGSRISYRQLDYWVRTRKIAPTRDADASGTGGERSWSPEDVATLGKVIDALEAARAVAAEFESGAMWKRLREELVASG